MRNDFPIMVAALAAVAGALCFSACDYVEPPQPALDRPETGTFFVGDSLHLSFSSAIEASSLSITVWPDLRDIENELPDTAVPLLEGCTAATSPCDTTALTVDADGLGASLSFDPENLGRPDVPLILEVEPGLTSKNGAHTSTSRFFDFQFKPVRVVDADVEFTEGCWIIVAVIEEPVPNIITLIAHMKKGPAGRIAVAGAEGDEKPGKPKNTKDPEELMVDAGEKGFAVFVYGTLTKTDDDERFFETDPFVLELRLGPIVVKVLDTRFTGKLVTDAETGDDRIEGTLSFSSINLDSGNGNPYDFPAGGTTFEAIYAPPDICPAGRPDVCGDLCGAVQVQCDPPLDFPGEGFCEPTE